ncbi:MAG: flippase-like domain-containing protein [Polyangiaceae bacterium]|nr:flippase-like domain-containing protein [Polyangiaceae bacterium]
MTDSLRKFLLALLMAVGLYGAFVIFSGFESLKNALQNFSWWTLFATLGLATANYGLRFLKWLYYLRILKIQPIPLRDNILAFLSGFALTVTPGKLGEMFKSAVLQSTYQIPAERTAPIVLAERLTDVISIVFMVLVGSTAFSGGLLWAIAGAVAVVAGLLLLHWNAPSDLLFQRLEKSQFKISNLVPQLKVARDSLQTTTQIDKLWYPSLLSTLGWTAEASGLWLLLQGFGQPISEKLALFFYSTSMLAGALIPVPGGLGVTEAMIQGQLVELGGVTSATATGAMLLLRLATLWWAVALGFISLALLKRRFPQLLRASENIEEA